MPYDSLLLQPMRDEVTRLGAQELRTPEAVDNFLADERGAALVFVNSVCGCAAGNARPALHLALDQTGPRPARVATVFAGQDVDATARLRSRVSDLPASSPAMILLKEGRPVAHIPRSAIEGRTAEDVAADLRAAFAEHCGSDAAIEKGGQR